MRRALYKAGTLFFEGLAWACFQLAAIVPFAAFVWCLLWVMRQP